MAAKKNKTSRSDASARPADGGKPTKAKAEAPAKPRHHNNDGFRETVESVVVAFILAFLFRTFEAEAFVIPTGSMAPTLYGRHKDVTCEKCGFHFTVGASDEVESGFLMPNRLIGDAVCPNCRYRTTAEVIRSLPVFKGDRILVDKYPYEFGNPNRWDVVVFKYPEEPQTNFIKRLVGLPGEQLQIRQGDVYRKTDEGVFILRKDDPGKQKVLQILVYDNDHPARELLKAGWPERWAGMKRDRGSRYGWSSERDGWQGDAEARTFHLAAEAAGDGFRWLRYRHFVPEQAEWDDVLDGRKPVSVRPKLITDFCGYNAYFEGTPLRPIDFGTYWVGDLTINCDVNVEQAGEGARLLLELLEGFRTYRCEFDLSSGECTLFYLDDNVPLDDPNRENERIVLGTASTPVKGSGRHKLTFANVDDRLCLWVDDDLVDFGTDEQGNPRNNYAPLRGAAYQPCAATDLAPVGLAAKNCTADISHLLLQRDIYYRAERVLKETQYQPEPEAIDEYRGGSLADLNALQHDPRAWWAEFSRAPSPVTFPRLGPDEFFMLGDNSPRSKDSRLWSNANRHAKHRGAVPRRLLVGKAFFVYWPHGVPFLNGGKGYPVLYHRDIHGNKTDYPSFRIPFYPNIGRMHRIR